MNYIPSTSNVSLLVLAIAIGGSFYALSRLFFSPLEIANIIKDILTWGKKDADPNKPNDQPKVWIDTQETIRLVLQERTIRQIIVACLCAIAVVSAAVCAVFANSEPNKSSNLGSTNAPALLNTTINLIVPANTNAYVLMLSTNITTLATNSSAQHSP